MLVCCCSLGHTAKFASYTVMELSTSKILVLDVKLIQVNEVQNSNAMKQEGLKRCCNFQLQYIMIGSIKTVRHGMITKYIRENHRNIYTLV